MRDDARAPALILTGPTGAGKTDWALRLARELPVEIVSVDSALVYRGLDIGTAKPDREARERVPHHLIDIRDPAESYSAGEFVGDAARLVGEIRARRRIPLLVGGTMLYLRALLRGIAELPRGSAHLRGEIDARAAREGWPAMHRELASVDPIAASRIHPNDPQRIQRALEVHRTTGRPISELQRATRAAPGFENALRWALEPDRAVLQSRLAARFHDMLARGFLDEVRTLRARGDLTAAHSSMRAVGYRQLWAHLDGECDLVEATRRGIAATRQLVKRQLTWLRSEPGIRAVDPDASEAQARWIAEVNAALSQLGR
ncbi:MAG: tRNA (adenosine(37)-N6)-dimethylallyltransferase MiaA [Gammaproteobacteria bacterium]